MHSPNRLMKARLRHRSDRPRAASWHCPRLRRRTSSILTRFSPALNPHYAPYDCWATGGGSICRGRCPGVLRDRSSWTGSTATAQTIYVSGRERQHISRWHDAGGNATKTILDTEIVDVFSLESGNLGPEVSPLRSRFTKHYDYPVPGDREQPGDAPNGRVVYRQVVREWRDRSRDGLDRVRARPRGRGDRPTTEARRTSSRTSTGSSAGVCAALTGA